MAVSCDWELLNRLGNGASPRAVAMYNKFGGTRRAWLWDAGILRVSERLAYVKVLAELFRDVD